MEKESPRSVKRNTRFGNSAAISGLGTTKMPSLSAKGDNPRGVGASESVTPTRNKDGRQYMSTILNPVKTKTGSVGMSGNNESINVSRISDPGIKGYHSPVNGATEDEFP